MHGAIVSAMELALFFLPFSVVEYMVRSPVELIFCQYFASDGGHSDLVLSHASPNSSTARFCSTLAWRSAQTGLFILQRSWPVQASITVPTWLISQPVAQSHRGVRRQHNIVLCTEYLLLWGGFFAILLLGLEGGIAAGVVLSALYFATAYARVRPCIWVDMSMHEPLLCSC